MSRLRRLPALRLARIGGWTAVATAGVAVAMTRFSGPAEVPVAPAIEPATPVVMTTTTGAALPTAPAGGLLVLHLSLTPGVPITAITTPTTLAEAAPPAAVAPPVTTTTVPAPPPVTSSGS